MWVDVRRSSSRFVSRTDRVESRHSFSFGPHYDPDNTRFGALVAHNEDVLLPGGGFDAHPHQGIDIVSWVLSGALRHHDDAGGSGVIGPGEAQVLRAGSGVRHAEASASSDVTRYVQMWVMSDVANPPAYAATDVSADVSGGGLVPVASGLVAAPLRLSCEATFSVCRLNGTIVVPDGPYVHLFVASGTVMLDGEKLLEGDAARVADASGLHVSGAAEVLVWSLG
jgi:quercetin 2,3-dioxygenase